MTDWQKLDQGLWVKDFPLHMLGTHIGRRVTVFELPDRILVHSTAPFSEADTRFMRELGDSILIMEATCFHDTFTREALTALPEASIYVPNGFPLEHENRRPLSELGSIVEPTLQLIPLRGMPKVNETIVFHPGSSTLVVADLVFNLQNPSAWTRFFLRWVANMREFPAVSRLFRMMIRDKAAFRESLQTILSLPVERLVMAHGSIIEKDARQELRRLLESQVE